MKTHLKVIWITLFLTFACIPYGFSQANNDYKIAFKDYHSANIVDIKLSQDKKYILTSDSDGKVLLFDANTLDYVKTVKPPGDIPISGIQLVKNDSILMMSQRYPTNYRVEYDTLVMKNMYVDSVLYKQQLSFKMIELGIDGYFGVLSSEENQFNRTFAVYNSNADVVATTALGLGAVKIAVSHDFKKIAYQPNIMSQEIVVGGLIDGSQSDTIPVPNSDDIVSLFFDKKNHDLFALTSDNQEQKIKVYNLVKNTDNEPIYSIDHWINKLYDIVTQYDSEQHIITVVNKDGLLGHSPVVIIRRDSVFSHQIVDLPRGATNAAINTEKQEIIFVNQGDFKNIRDLSVYSYGSGQITTNFPKMTSDFYSALFLPDNSWVALKTGYGDNIIDLTLGSRGIVANEDIKYFSAGTFNNRFRTLGFRDHIETRFHVISYFAKLIEQEGIAVIFGSPKNNLSGQTNYYTYNFANDELTQVTDTKLGLRTFQDYSLAKNHLLLSNDLYTNHGYTESIKLELVKDNNNIIPIEGDYKFGRFSNDGNYLLTIDKDNLLHIISIEQMDVIFSKSLRNGSYTVYSIDQSAFAVSNLYREHNMNECNRETETFEVKDKQVVTNTLPCTIVTGFAQVGNTAGLIIEGFGISVNNKTKAFTKSDFPKSISFNQDGSKFILSLTNGKNVIYDTERMEPLGYMIHPDGKSHIFYDVNNNYFSNIDPAQFLYAEENGNQVSLRQVENEFFNPEEILKLFGTPDQQYLAALQKAIELRKNNDVPDDQITHSQSTPVPVMVNSDAPPNLYLLSVGVSDYQDNAYSLTFSDKDAIDMAKIYGHLDDSQLKMYNDKFFGERYTVYNQDNRPLATIHNYEGLYSSFTTKHLLDLTGNLWLGNQYGKYTIWDYQGKTIDSISLPAIKSTGFSPDLDKLIFVKPDNTGFYLKGEEDVFEYLFSTKQFNPVSLPFEPTKENFVPLNGNKWLHFDDRRDTLTITTGQFGSDNTAKSYVLTFPNSEKIFRDMDTDGSSKTDTIWASYKMLKTTSANGRYVFYSMTNYSGHDLFVIDLHQQEIIPTRLPIKIENQYNYTVSVDETGSQFYSMYSLQDPQDEYNTIGQRLIYYDMNGKELKTQQFDVNYGEDGVANNGISYYYMKKSEGLLTKGLLDHEDILEQTTPHTFGEVYTEYIVNEDANSKAIGEKLKTFFDKASPQDQVMVFLAGHGVLDEKNNYYFAPYDMDFDQVDKSGVSFETILQSLQKSPAQNKLLLMDTCHSGKTIDLEENTGDTEHKEHGEGNRGSTVVSLAVPRYKVSDVISTLFEDFLSNSGVTILSASSGGDLAQEHPNWGNGAFTSSYIKVLKNKMAGMAFSIREEHTKHPIVLDDSFINELYKEVIGLTDGKQMPDIRELNKKAKISVW